MAKAAPSEAPDTIPPDVTGERCDRCGVRACRRYVFATGELFFCQHHSREFAGALAQQVLIPRRV